MSTPENQVSAEGRTLKAALEAAAEQLGVPLAQVDHKIDLAHFRTANGAGVGATTVKIFAWAKDAGDTAPALAAEAWVRGLLAAMGREGTVRADVRGAVTMVHVDVGEAGRHLVGRGGTTLRAVQLLMEGAIGAAHPDVKFKIDVARAEGDERRDEPRADYRREERPPERRDDRPYERRDDRPYERRDDRRGDRRGPPREGGDRRDARRGDDEELRRLARKIANIVLDRGEPEVIRRELNSYDRRLVHLEIAQIEGVGSRSVGEGYDRRVEIYPRTPDEPSDGGPSEQG